MKKLLSVAVYCSSSNKVRTSYMDAAEQLGRILAEAGIRLVYGDGGIGLMAAVAKGALDAGGEVLGVIPQFMVDQGWNNPRSSQTIITQTMHERKSTICEVSDAMVPGLPGHICHLQRDWGQHHGKLLCFAERLLGNVEMLLAVSARPQKNARGAHRPALN